MAQPIKPNFIKEREQQKEEQEQLRIKEQHKKEKQEKRDKKITNKSKENTSDKKIKIPTFIIVGILIFIVCLIGAIVFFKKQANQTENTETIATSSVQDLSEQVKNEETDKYSKEAKAIWNKYKNELDCNETTFTKAYKEYRDQGLAIDEAYGLVWNEYMKVDVEPEENKEESIITTENTEEIITEEIEEPNQIEEITENTEQNNNSEKKDIKENSEPQIKSVPQQQPINQPTQNPDNSFENEIIDEVEVTPWIAPEEEWAHAGDGVDPSWTVE